MGDDKHRDELVSSFKNRALVYKHLYEELSTEFGAEKAAEVLRRAIYKRGVEIGRRYAKYAPGDMQGLCDAFIGDSPCNGSLFAPVIEKCDPEGLDITFRKCPLKEAWLEEGLPESEVARLCEIAAVVDIGVFKGNGFEFSAETYKPGGDGCCHLHIRPKR